MKLGALLGFAAGIGLSIWLLASYGVTRILDLLGHAGWFGITSVIAFHFVQILFSAAAWRVITGPVTPRPSLGGFMIMRWIREGVNNLLPVAQIGGEFVVSRLLHRAGMPLAQAIAGTVCDLTLEMVTQIGFTLLGLVLLLHSVGGSGIATDVASGTGVAAIIAGIFVSAQWLGLASAIEAALMKLGRTMGWAKVGKVEGLHKALLACYRSPRRLALSASYQMISWLLGGFEVCLALHFLGHDVGIVPGLIIESLGQALKAVGFAVPGALGVQEGGYIVVCHLFGLSPEVSIALSLMKRLREVILGTPSLIAWQRREASAPISCADALPHFPTSSGARL